MDKSYFFDEPLSVGNKPQLLIDDYMIEDRWDVNGVLNIPSKHPKNPVLLADRPWEESLTGASVIYDEDEQFFRMWYVVGSSEAYHTRPGQGKHTKKLYYQVLAYAESSDGINWEKPELKVVDYHGFDKSNVVLTGVTKADCALVMETPEPLEDKGKYMASYRDIAPGGDNGLYLAFSDNGVEWKTDPDNCLFQGILDTQHNLVYDDDRKIWLFYTRPLVRAAKDRDRNENVRTRIAVAVSDDLRDMKKWHSVREVIEPDNVDNQRLRFFDHMIVTRYGSHFLGLLSVHPRDADAKGHLELAYSSDGFNWKRDQEKTPYIGNGPDGSFDAGQTWCSKKIVTVGDWMYLYYGASNIPWRIPTKQAGIGLARIRKGRFVGQFADGGGGFLLTRQIRLGGRELEINCVSLHHTFNRGLPRTSKTSHGAGQFGYIRVEVEDSDGTPISGFTFEDCDDITMNSTHHTVSWNGKTDLSSLVGKSVYLRFYLQNSYLYSFRFSD